MGQGELQDLEQPTCAGVQIGAVLDSVLGIHIGPGGHQQARGFHLVGMGGGQQGGAARAVAPIHGYALLQLLAQHGGVTACGGFVQGSGRHGVQQWQAAQSEQQRSGTVQSVAAGVKGWRHGNATRQRKRLPRAAA